MDPWAETQLPLFPQDGQAFPVSEGSADWNDTSHMVRNWMTATETERMTLNAKSFVSPAMSQMNPQMSSAPLEASITLPATCSGQLPSPALSGSSAASGCHALAVDTCLPLAGNCGPFEDACVSEACYSESWNIPSPPEMVYTQSSSSLNPGSHDDCRSSWSSPVAAVMEPHMLPHGRTGMPADRTGSPLSSGIEEVPAAALGHGPPSPISFQGHLNTSLDDSRVAAPFIGPQAPISFHFAHNVSSFHGHQNVALQGPQANRFQTNGAAFHALAAQESHQITAYTPLEPAQLCTRFVSSRPIRTTPLIMPFYHSPVGVMTGQSGALPHGVSYVHSYDMARDPSSSSNAFGFPMHRRSSEFDPEAVRNHPWYKLERKEDSLFHCPLEREKECKHQPQRLWCNYA